MNNSCLGCGRCCTQFGVCVSPFDVRRICRETGMQPEEFLDLIPDYPEREREEPAILIDGESCILVLKRSKEKVCCFYSGSGCNIYKNRPMLCRTYPFRVNSFQCTVLGEMKSRDCPKRWMPEGKEKEQYLADCKEYLKHLEEYKRLARKWNENEGGSFVEFLAFISNF